MWNWRSWMPALWFGSSAKAPRTHDQFLCYVSSQEGQTGEGLAAAVYGIFGDDETKLRDLLRIPDDFTLVAGISIGYPLPDPGWSSKTSRTTQRRRAVDEVVRWNAWTS